MQLSAEPLRVAPVRAFLRLSRPLFLYGGFAGVALGAAVARWTGHPLVLREYLWVQLLVTAFHLMVHYANDYFDRESDLGAERTRWSGGSGVLVEGHLSPRVALIAAFVCIAFGLVAAGRFVAAGNPLVALIGIAILVFAWCYSAPPVRFASRGLGELDTALVVALLFPLAGYAAFTHTIDGAISTAALAPALAMIAMMLCVEIPDAGCDVRAGKRNLVVRLGTPRARGLVTLAAAGAIAGACVLAARGFTPVAYAALIPAVLAGMVLVAVVRGRPRPGATAFWGVAFYAALITGLAAGYWASR